MSASGVFGSRHPASALAPRNVRRTARLRRRWSWTCRYAGFRHRNGSSWPVKMGVRMHSDAAGFLLISTSSRLSCFSLFPFSSSAVWRSLIAQHNSNRVLLYLPHFDATSMANFDHNGPWTPGYSSIPRSTADKLHHHTDPYLYGSDVGPSICGQTMRVLASWQRHWGWSAFLGGYWRSLGLCWMGWYSPSRSVFKSDAAISNRTSDRHIRDS
ncbi:hypothetical protein OH76DRAFT_980098 [Lentinus brumalis]|uniref:Uncharacterized protein n=1 Tax=Lentinus brumalis TaxID=2498619 RepID=A0A371DPY6_9APHY|nr:hypothetical protein OH76DRAFT_980098 [Polyporus brumalis]